MVFYLDRVSRLYWWREVLYKCKLRGLSILPGSIFYYNKRNSCKIRISFLSTTMEEIETGIKIMENVLINCEGAKKITGKKAQK